MSFFLLLLLLSTALADDFSVDPQWEGVNNRPIAQNCVTVRQDFGWHPDRKAVGGTISRSISHAHYAAVVGPLSMSDRTIIRGTVEVPVPGDGVAYIGWFNNNAQQFKPANFLGFRIVSESNGVFADPWVFTQTWRGFGSKRALSVPPGKQTFELDWEPGSQDGGMRLIVAGQSHTLWLPPGLLADGATYNRFGLFNVLWSPQATIGLFVDDLVFTTTPGQVQQHSFGANPNWSVDGNNVNFTDCRTQNNPDFGWSASRQEVGGLMFRTDPGVPIYYAEPLDAPTDLDSPLEFSGTVTFIKQMVDSGAHIGWFNRSTVGELVPRGSLTILVEGATVEGHRFSPVWVDDSGVVGRCPGPIIRPDHVERTWTFAFDPLLDQIEMEFEGSVHTCEVPDGLEGSMDAFGIFPYRRHGGGPLEIWFDDLVHMP